MREALASTLEARTKGAAALHPEVVHAIRAGLNSPELIEGIEHRADPDASVMAADGEPECATCRNMRFLIGVDGKLKACVDCGVAAGRVVASMQNYSSANGRAETQFFHNFKADWDGGVNVTLALAKVAAQEFASSPSGFLVLWGERGHGKSHLCAAIYNALRGKNIPAIFIKMSRLASSVKRLYNDEVARAEGLSAEDWMDRYSQAPILLIDDIGADNYTSHDDGILSTIVDYRYANRLPTVFVSNWDVRNVDDTGNYNARFDPRIVSRWNDTEFSNVLRTISADYRLRTPKPEALAF